MMTDKEYYDGFTTTKLRYGGKWTCVHCPVQADGRLVDGRPWYFRARHGAWSLRIGKREDEDAVSGEWVAEGDDPWEGFMPAHEAAARIHQVLKWHDNPHAAAVSGCTGTGEGFDMSALGTVYSTPTEPVHWHWEGSLTPPGWFEWKGAPDWEREHPTAPLPVEFVHVRCCTATTAVLEGVGR